MSDEKNLANVTSKMLSSNDGDPWKRAEQVLLGNDPDVEQAVQNDLPANEAETVRRLQQGFEGTLETLYQKGYEDAQEGRQVSFQEHLQQLKGNEE